MKLMVFSVYDQAVQAFMPPFYVRSKGEALRSFTEACNDEKHNFYKHATDYTLMLLGEFDDGAGVFDTAQPARMISAFECVADNPFTSETKIRDASRLPM